MIQHGYILTSHPSNNRSINIICLSSHYEVGIWQICPGDLSDETTKLISDRLEGLCMEMKDLVDDVHENSELYNWC